MFAALRHSLQPQKIPQVHPKTSEKRSRNARFLFFAEKQTNKHRYIGFKSSEFRLNPDDPKKKNRLKRLIYVRNVTFYSLVQWLPVL